MTDLEKLKDLAFKNDVEAQYKLGVLYETGDGVPQHYENALKYYQQATDLPLYANYHAGAQNNLGRMHENGLGVSKDDKEARRQYKCAAAQGHTEAQYNLGRMYKDGLGGKQDSVEAHTLFNVAATNGHKEAGALRDEVEEKMTPDQVKQAHHGAAVVFDTPRVIREK